MFEKDEDAFLRMVSVLERSGCAAVISRRSGEAGDTTIADMVVTLNAGQIKEGGTSAVQIV